MTDKLREAEREAFETAYTTAYPFAASAPGKFDRDQDGYADVSVAVGWRMWQAALAQQDAQAVPQGHNLIDADELRHIMRDAERYRFIRDAGRSECISYEIRTYAMETLDGYVDAAIEDEAAMQEKQA